MDRDPKPLLRAFGDSRRKLMREGLTVVLGAGECGVKLIYALMYLNTCIMLKRMARLCGSVTCPKAVPKMIVLYCIVTNRANSEAPLNVK